MTAARWWPGSKRSTSTTKPPDPCRCELGPE
jgi:hypothetical protein